MHRLLCLLPLALLAACGEKTELAAKTTSVPVVTKTHVVLRGEFLRGIAAEEGVAPEALLLANEKLLQEKYEEVCDDLSDRFRNRKRDGGTRRGGLYYCNDRFNRPYGNTLLPGWTLAIPASQAPEKISSIVSEIEGNRIALVIDDTGSMSNDRAKVGEFYLAALRAQKKRLAGVWLYSDGQVRRYEAGGVEFLTTGGNENTFAALTEAAEERPDTIILVTDEPGDDWRWHEASRLPPVVGHCLPDQGQEACRENLQRLARETRGRYVTGLN